MKIIITADDFGAASSVNSHIIEGFEKGVLTHASVLPQGSSFDYACEYLKQNENLGVSVHLNITEGKPLLDLHNANTLTDSGGYFKHSFISLWFMYFFASATTKQNIREQVTKEFQAQLEFVKKEMGDRIISKIDSHEHVHMIPFVWDALADCGISSKVIIRIPYEPFRLLSMKAVVRVSLYNFLKNILLLALSVRARLRAERNRQSITDFCVGIILTGGLTADDVDFALEKIYKQNPNSTVEILFHPGYADDQDMKIWDRNSRFKKFYCSNDRKNELTELKSESLKQVFANYLSK
jgi:predicted glycoside hydrolase/deacetylase ChbG (UPF0249 family)